MTDDRIEYSELRRISAGFAEAEGFEVTQEFLEVETGKGRLRS
jgi:hypothetical protein